jgi:hypothetical protein
LEAGVDYRARVCAIRLTSEGLSLNSPFSPATHFYLPRPEDLASGHSVSRTSKASSDNHLYAVDHHHQAQSISFVYRYRLSLARKFKSLQLFETRTLTDQQWAILIFVGFTLLAICIAIFANVVYSKYNTGLDMPVEDAFASSPPPMSPGMKK